MSCVGCVFGCDVTTKSVPPLSVDEYAARSSHRCDFFVFCFNNIHRKRKKGCLKLEGEEKEGSTAEEKTEEPLEKVEEGRTDVSENNVEKKKADDLWASFLSDVGSRPKPSSCTPQSSSAQQVCGVFRN